ncbi:hypothetical protein LCGC14_0783260 [marine sediment metagenome]|uniref:Uncharacterized protein n=1 Tax=marine sediment metagenome TaxID=412755 RepID=A0A0F9PZ37_9ZZZZ
MASNTNWYMTNVRINKLLTMSIAINGVGSFGSKDIIMAILRQKQKRIKILNNITARNMLWLVALVYACLC